MQPFLNISRAILALLVLAAPTFAQNEQTSRELAQQLKGIFLSADQTLSTVIVKSGIDHHEHYVIIDDNGIRFTTWSTGQNEHCQITRDFGDSTDAISYVDWGCSGSAELVLDRFDDVWQPERTTNDTERAAYQLLLQSYSEGLEVAIRMINAEIRAADIDLWTRLTPAFRTFNNNQNIRLILDQSPVTDDFSFFSPAGRDEPDVYLWYRLDVTQEFIVVSTRFAGNHEANGDRLIEYRANTRTGMFEQSRWSERTETGDVVDFTPWLDMTESQQPAASLALQTVAVASGIPTDLQISE